MSYPAVPDWSTAFPPKFTSRNAGSFWAFATRYSRGFRSPRGLGPDGGQLLVHQGGQTGQDRRRLGGAAADGLLLFEDDPDPGERVGHRGDVGYEPPVGQLGTQPDRLPRRATEQGRRAPAVPWVSGTLYQACSSSQSPSASVDSLVPPTATISGSEATASTPTSSGEGGADHRCPPLHSRPARSPVALNGGAGAQCAGQGGAHRGEVGGGEEPVASPADGEAPHRSREAVGHRLHQPAQLLEGPTAVVVRGGTGVDQDQLRVRHDPVDHLQIHAGFPRTLSGIPPITSGVNRGRPNVSA